LFFLSDGRPSDGFGKAGGHDAANKKIINLVGEICAEFGSRLTFGAFGFAPDDGKMF
jgi:hypothetical protein